MPPIGCPIGNTRLETKQDYSAWALDVLRPLLPYYSAGGARLRLGGSGATYSADAIELEAFSRPLWALGPLWAGGGESAEFAAVYRRGLANGTNPQSPEYWGGFEDYDQRFVEMAAIACGLMLAPGMLWQPLTPAEQQNLAAWLLGINRHEIPDCNWHFFRVLVNLALQKRGMAYSPEKLAESLALIDSYYIGGGWYQDGGSCQKDYYVSFALHYYGLVYAGLMADEDALRAAEYIRRAESFGRDFVYWFDENGAALPFGRSLTYRFAQGSFWAACLFAGAQPLPTPVLKGLLTRHLQYWSAQDMFERDGVLSIGYAYKNLTMAENYNAPGSPYWAMKTLLVLALPDEHPFWAAEAAPLPQLAAVKPLPKGDMLVQRLAKGGAVAFAPGVCRPYGHGHVAQKYAKFAYSTRLGFSIAHSAYNLEENAPDSMLAFVAEGTDTVHTRLQGKVYEIRPDGVYCEWTPTPGIEVKTTLTPTEWGHIRHHEVQADFAVTAYDCGFSVPWHGPGNEESCTDGAFVQGGGEWCRVKSESGTPVVLKVHPNTNLLFRNTKLPAVAYTLAPGRHILETHVHYE